MDPEIKKIELLKAKIAQGYHPEIVKIFDDLFDKQIEVIKDKRKKKAVLCTRRAGKTFLLVYYLVYEALRRPNSACVYISLTKKYAKKLIWKPLKEVIEKYGYSEMIEKKNEQEGTIEFKNGSSIYIEGADNTAEIEKLRGFALKLVVLDESGSFGAYFESLIIEILSPTLKDWSGSMILTGTPHETCAGLFHDVTSPKGTKRSGWGVWQWSVKDNPKFPRWVGKENWRELAEQFVEDVCYEDFNGNFEDPAFMREWLAVWIRSMEKFVYKYDPEQNSYNGLLPGGHDWKYIMGVDLGYDDSFAIEVVGYCYDLPDVYEVEAFKDNKMIPSEWADKIKDFKFRYDIDIIVADSGGLGKAIIQEFNTRHKLFVRHAEKKAKWDYIELLNGDMRNGICHILKDGQLHEEMLGLKRDANKLRENDNDPNHCCDAFLYAWREAKHWTYKPKKKIPKRGTKEYSEYQERMMKRQAETRVKEKSRKKKWHMSFIKRWPAP